MTEELIDNTDKRLDALERVTDIMSVDITQLFDEIKRLSKLVDNSETLKQEACPHEDVDVDYTFDGEWEKPYRVCYVCGKEWH